ncbi:MAG TPA: hypothetical protein VGM96_27910 [Reyranella sp.]|jgi:hypothetical protein
MRKSILLAVLLAVPLGGCGWFSRPEAAQPPAPASATDIEALKSAFVPYCGPVWPDRKQGYINIPCPAGSNYLGASGL